MKIAFSGGRDRNLTEAELGLTASLFRAYKGEKVLVGDCPTGVDEAVRGFHWTEAPYCADWKEHGKAAGPIRNQRMIEDADMLVAFPGHGYSRGTRDCIKRAKAKGIPVIVFEPGRP